MTITAPDPTVDPTAVPQTKGPLRRALDRFFENRAARAGLLIIVPILLAVSTYHLW
ncbi:MAG: ABC transporter permease, partial [Mesorhizobium sp.]